MAQKLVVVWRSSDLMCNNSLLTFLVRASTLESWALAGLLGYLRATCTRESKITKASTRTNDLNTFGGHRKQRSDDCNFAAIHSDQLFTTTYTNNGAHKKKQPYTNSGGSYVK